MFHNKSFFSDIIITFHFGRIDTDVSVVGTNMKIILWDDFVCFKLRKRISINGTNSTYLILDMDMDIYLLFSSSISQLISNTSVPAKILSVENHECHSLLLATIQ
jgi:hypothetical protein